MAQETGQGTGRSQSSSSPANDRDGNSRSDFSFDIPGGGSVENESSAQGAVNPDAGDFTGLFDPGVNAGGDNQGTATQRQLYEYFGGDALTDFPETETNIIQDLFGINERLVINPFDRDVREVYDVGISPLSILAGGLFGPAGTAAALIARTAGMVDPLGFDVTIDPSEIGSQVAAGAISGRPGGDGDDKSTGKTSSSEKKANADQVAQGTDVQEEFRARVEAIIGNAKLENFPMPEFRLLDPQIGGDTVDLASIVQKLMGLEDGDNADTPQTETG